MRVSVFELCNSLLEIAYLFLLCLYYFYRNQKQLVDAEPLISVSVILANKISILTWKWLVVLPVGFVVLVGCSEGIPAVPRTQG